MAGGNQFTIQEDILEPLAAKTANGTSAKTLSTATARVVEYWVVTSANTATANFIFESSMDGTNFAELGRITGVATNATFNIVFNRADNALGKVVRVKWEVPSGSITFEVKQGRME